eukprot:scaffold1378_cov160-Amphora_coffeaeformis.AAC.3
MVSTPVSRKTMACVSPRKGYVVSQPSRVAFRTCFRCLVVDDAAPRAMSYEECELPLATR